MPNSALVSTPIQNTRFDGAPFGPLLSGDLGIDGGDCLFWYDCPIMWLAKDSAGEPWLINTMDDDSNGRTTTYLAIPVTATQEAALRSMTPICDFNVLTEVYVSAAGGWIVTESWDGSVVVAARPATDADYAEARPSND